MLVTLVSGNLNGEPFGDPEAKNGLYRIESDGSNTLVADLGQWSVDNPPEPAIVVDTGVHFALETYLDGFLVTDGHHNRVLWVSQNGSIDEVATFEQRGADRTGDGRRRRLRHPTGPDPASSRRTAKSSPCAPNSEAREVASGASMLIDVERGPHDQLYAVSTGSVGRCR